MKENIKKSKHYFNTFKKEQLSKNTLLHHNQAKISFNTLTEIQQGKNTMQLQPWDHYETELYSIEDRKKQWLCQQNSQKKNTKKRHVVMSFDQTIDSSSIPKKRHNCSKCSSLSQYNLDKNDSLTKIQQNQNILSHTNKTSHQQKLKWCLQLQFMLKKRKKMTTLMKNRQYGGYYRSNTINANSSESPNVSVQKQDLKPKNQFRFSFFKNNISTSGIQSAIHTVRDKTNFTNNNSKQKINQHSLRATFKQQFTTLISSPQKDEYTGLIKSRGNLMGYTNISGRKTETAHQYSKTRGKSLPISQNQNYSFRNENRSTLKTQLSRPQKMLTQYSKQIDNEVYQSTNKYSMYNPIQNDQNLQNNVKFNTNKPILNLGKMRTIKDRLKMNKLIKSKNRNSYTNRILKTMEEAKQQKSVERRSHNKSGSQKKSSTDTNIKKDTVTGFGSYRQQIESCTISKIKYEKRAQKSPLKTSKQKK